jgi:membrane protein
MSPPICEIASAGSAATELSAHVGYRAERRFDFLGTICGPLHLLSPAKISQGDASRAAAEALMAKISDLPARRPEPVSAVSTSDRSAEPAGRGAGAPTDIPPTGWRDVLLRVFHGISDDRITTISGGVTFFVLLALFPGLAGLISLYGLFADSGTIGQHLTNLEGILPEGGMQILRDQLQQLTSQPAQKLGFATAASLAVSLWSANGGVKAMFEGLNAVYEEHEQRSFFKLNAISLALTFGILAFVIASLLTITVVPKLLSFLGLPGISDIVSYARWPVLLFVAALMIAVIYRFGPSRDQPQWRWISPGSTFAALTWIAASLLFSWYTTHFGSYNKTYGSLGAAIGFMTWIWISTMVVLVGAKINAELERQTAADTTAGKSCPRGERGAGTADMAGPSS